VTAQGTADGLLNSQEIDCYHVDAAGTATLASVSLNVAGNIVTFK